MAPRSLSTSVEARWLVPVTDDPIERGSVLLVDDQIVDVGKGLRGDRHIKLEDGVLLPGLVNAHTHLEFSHLRKPLNPGSSSFDAWIRAVIEERRGRDQTSTASVQQGLNESEHAAVTRLGEIATELELGALTANSDTHGVRFYELIGLHPQRQAEALVAASHYAEAAPPPGWQSGLSPHAPYTVGMALLESVIELARKRSLPIAMHVAETPEELEFIQNRSGPMRELLESLGAWQDDAIPNQVGLSDYIERLASAPRALVIHGNYLDEPSIQALVDHRDTMSLVYCPRTHAFFEHSPYPLAQLLARGVRMALGTDSRASNPDLEIWEDAKFVAASHPQVPPQRIVEMCTIRAAEALGVRLSAIQPHHSADLTVVQCACENADPLEAILQPRARAVSLRVCMEAGEMPMAE